MKINNETSVKTDIKTIGGVVIAVAISVYSYFTVIERISNLELQDKLQSADLLKKAEQEPKNLEIFMLIEHLSGQIEKMEEEIEASRYNKVNIDHLKEQVDMLQKKLNGNH
jgi:galactokinase/mevalonate kinase-like predicted kinase